MAYPKKSKSSGVYLRPTPFQSTIYFLEIYTKNYINNFECNLGTKLIVKSSNIYKTIALFPTNILIYRTS